MKKIIHTVLVYSISFSLYAQDCGVVPDGTVARLDSEGKSLSNSKVQDQDGIGSCYANTASIMLEGSLEGRPEVSYINLALQNAERFNLAKKGSFAFNDKDELLLNGGYICDIINSVQKDGGVCLRKDVPIENVIFNTKENNFQDSKFIQKEVIKKVSVYYD